MPEMINLCQMFSRVKEGVEDKSKDKPTRDMLLQDIDV